MSEYSNNESSDIIVYAESLPAESEQQPDSEKITVLEPQRKLKMRKALRIVLQYWRFAATVTAFAAIILCVYYFCCNNSDDPYSLNGSASGEEDTFANLADSDSEEEVFVSADPEKEIPVIFDEARTGLDIMEYLDDDFCFYPVIGGNADISVIIIHSHASEYVSESMSVIDAGEAIAGLLNSAGIGTIHCTTEHDSEGSIGAYERMRESLDRIREEYPQAVLVIDLHDSDTNMPLTFTVGTDSSFGWKENLRIAASLYNMIEGCNGAVRLLPDSIGQNNGLLTLNVGICGRESDDEAARKVVSSFVNAFINACTESTPA